MLFALLSFVQRQSGFAFFGALTAVDALFILFLFFGGKDYEKTFGTHFGGSNAYIIS